MRYVILIDACRDACVIDEPPSVRSYWLVMRVPHAYSTNLRRPALFVLLAALLAAAIVAVSAAYAPPPYE